MNRRVESVAGHRVTEADGGFECLNCAEVKDSRDAFEKFRCDGGGTRFDR